MTIRKVPLHHLPSLRRVSSKVLFFYKFFKQIIFFFIIFIYNTLLKRLYNSVKLKFIFLINLKNVLSGRTLCKIIPHQKEGAYCHFVEIFLKIFIIYILKYKILLGKMKISNDRFDILNKSLTQFSRIYSKIKIRNEKKF